jgi:hypothetical protein
MLAFHLRKVAAVFGMCLTALAVLPNLAEAGCLFGCWSQPCIHSGGTVATAGVAPMTSSALVPMSLSTASVPMMTTASVPMMTTASVPMMTTASVPMMSTASVPMSMTTASVPTTTFYHKSMFPMFRARMATASLPMMFHPAATSQFVTSGVGTASVAGYYATPTVAAPAPTSSASSPLPALLPNSVGAASVASLRPASVSGQSTAGPTMAETVAEYNAFVQNENALSPASVLPAADVNWLNSSHPALVQAAGVNRLHSVGRFLKSKVGDPNFQKTALNIFGAVLGTAVPQVSPFLPFIKDFLGQINPGASDGTPPPPAAGTTPPPPAAGTNTGGSLSIPGGSSGALTVHVIFDNAPPTATPPKATDAPPKPTDATTPPKPTDATGAPVTVTSPLDTLEGVFNAMGTKFTRDATGITVTKPDNSTVKFGPTGKPVVPGQ